MKAVLISIQPKWCELIASGKKTVEVRKTVPKLEPPFKCYIYCTKKKKPDEYGDLIFYENPDGICVENGVPCSPLWTGKVIGEFVCDQIEEFTPTEKGIAFKRFRALYDSCLSVAEIRAYLGGKVGYGWHISDLVIYDEPKELSAFSGVCKFKNEDGTCRYREVACSFHNADYNPDNTINLVECMRRVERPPQSWCYVEADDGK